MAKKALLFVMAIFLLQCNCTKEPSQNGKENQMSSKKQATRTVEKTVEIAAPVSAVWKALTEAEELKRWFPLDAEVKPGAGGTIRLLWGDKFEWVFKIEIWATEKHLRLVYSHETDFNAKELQKGLEKPATLVSDISGQLAVDYFLEGSGGKTTLRLVHSGFGADAKWDEEYDSVRRGWNVELDNLKYYLERHHGQDRAVAWAVVEIQESMEAAWQKLMGKEGLVQTGSLDGLREGAAYDFQSAMGDDFSGAVQEFNPPLDFSGTVKNLNDAVLRVKIEQYGGQRTASIWLSAYGLPAAQVTDFETRANALLQKLFGRT
jgi:uncharacterized protein YndB with AHSA1/START domain